MHASQDKSTVGLISIHIRCYWRKELLHKEYIIYLRYFLPYYVQQLHCCEKGISDTNFQGLH